MEVDMDREKDQLAARRHAARVRFMASGAPADLSDLMAAIFEECVRVTRAEWENKQQMKVKA